MIQMGIRFNASMGIFGYSAQAMFFASPDTRWAFSVSVSPMRFGFGMFVLQRSLEDEKQGPIATLSGRLLPFPKLEVYIEGFVASIMFAAGIKIVLSPTMMEFRVVCSFFYGVFSRY